MSGHSKWANIKVRKGAQDKKRSEAFTKMSKMILTAIRLGGGNTNVNTNSYLKTAVDKAREVNMPKENIERLLARFEERRNNLTNFMLEGYGPGAVPMIIEVETDNKNRILGEIRLIFKEHGGELGESGTVMYQFDRKGEVELESVSEDKELELIDAGAEEIGNNIILVEPINLNNFKKKAEELGFKIVRAELIMKAKMPVKLSNEEEVGRVLDLVDALEENDDVVNVFTAFDYGT